MSKKFLTPIRPPSLATDPSSSNIGDIYFNTTYGVLKLKTSTGWEKISTFPKITLQQVNTLGQSVNSYSDILTLQFDEDSGFTVTNPSAGIAKIAMNSTFKYWEIDGILKLTATGLDTINFKSGYGISITADGLQSPQELTISSTLQTVQGIQGYLGSQGTRGLQGYNGIQGTQGLDGASAAQGIQGVQGNSGYIGMDGAQGVQGVQGTTGEPIANLDGGLFNSFYGGINPIIAGGVL